MNATPVRGARFAALVFAFLAMQNICFAGPQKWIELRTPHFVVVTNGSERDARQAAEQFEVIRGVFRQYFKTVSANEQPLVIVAASDESTFRQLLPEALTQKGAAQRSGIYWNGVDKSYIYLRLDMPYVTIYHEYVHYVMRRLTPKLPTWMVEGLAEFYSNVRIESKTVWVGAPSANALAILNHQALLPLTTLFAVNASSPYYNERSKTSIFYAESWALTHYLMARDWKDNTRRLSDFVDLLGPNVSQADAARRTIGDPAVLEPALNDYVRKLAFTAARVDKPEIQQGATSTRELSEAESLAIRADLVAHQGQYPKAQSMLEESIKLDPKLALAYQVLAFSHYQQRKIVDAEQASAQALSLDPQNYLANYYHSASLLRGAYADDHIVTSAIAGFQVVIATHPDFAPAYDGMAYALARPGIHQKLDEAHKMVLRALELDPANLLYSVHVAQILAQMGRADEAVNAATAAASMAKTPAEQSFTANALSALQKFQASQNKTQESAAASPSVTPTEGADGEANSSQSNISIQSRIEVLTDATGVDFDSYLRPVGQNIQKTWNSIAPVAARPPILKKRQSRDRIHHHARRLDFRFAPGEFFRRYHARCCRIRCHYEFSSIPAPTRGLQRAVRRASLELHLQPGAGGPSSIRIHLASRY